MTNRTATVLPATLTASLIALCLAACAPGIDIGQATGTGTSTGTGTGTGTGGALDAGVELNPNPLDMGTVVVDTAVTQSVVVTNLTGVEIDGITATVSGTNAGWFTLAGVPSTLAADSSSTISVTFAPLETASPAEALVTVSATGFDPATLALRGTSVAPALVFTTETIDFGYVSLLTTAVACTTVTNIANVDVSITGISNFASEGNCYELATTDDSVPPNPFSLPIDLAPGASAKVCFAFTPPITQEYDGQATLVTTDPTGNNPIIHLSAWGGGPQIYCTPLDMNFGATPVGTTSTLSVICTNDGTAIPGANLELGSISVPPGAFGADLDAGAEADGLAPGQSAAIEVSYTPTTDGGSDTASLQIDSNGGQGHPVVIQLSGSGS